MNGGYDPEGLMQQYRDWEKQQWQPPSWGQPPPVTVNRNQYPNFYPSPWQVPIAEAGRRMVDEPLAEYWGLPATAAVGGGVPSRAPSSMFFPIREALDRSWQQPPTGIQTTGIGGQTMERPPYIPGQEQTPLMERPSFTPRWESTPEAWKNPPAFLEQVLGESGPFTPGAREYFQQQLKIQIEEPGQTSGGGFWRAGENIVDLLTAQPGAMVHELSHAWWDTIRETEKEAFVEAVIRYADESQQYETKPPLGQLAIDFVYGVPSDPSFSSGMKITGEEGGAYSYPGAAHVNEAKWNDVEMYAGIASGMQGDIRRLPPYLQQFYEGLFSMLPPEAPGRAFPESREQWGTGETIAPIPQGTAEWGYQSLWPEERARVDQMRRESAMRKQP